MPDLGNLTGRLHLWCKTCQWKPPENMTAEHARLHFQVDHDTDQIEFDLIPGCACGEPMELVTSRPTGGGFKDYFICRTCGSTGFVRRET